ncbi:hypothetical protein C1645_793017 [Glomus cerebriforme]|uniref:Uncharacterized protein n=1 Tax=Glomus cerebriforme TaxID=658196 RepID=A0A397S7B7_9GLOM|nr:hypothetical protein C1645_793017 [Glomus cerebriforme]
MYFEKTFFPIMCLDEMLTFFDMLQMAYHRYLIKFVRIYSSYLIDLLPLNLIDHHHYIDNVD